jgi:hypothetical protein
LFFQPEFHSKQHAFGQNYDSIPDCQLNDPCFIVDDVNKVVFGLTLFRNVGGFLFLWSAHFWVKSLDFWVAFFNERFAAIILILVLRSRFYIVDLFQFKSRTFILGWSPRIAFVSYAQRVNFSIIVSWDQLELAFLS